MSLFGAMNAGVSGLASQSSAMAAISDNITNVNTVGYKGTKVDFQTLVTRQASNTLYSSGGVQSRPRTGIDVQGLLQTSSSTTDLAISGDGFFLVNEAPQPGASDQYLFSRAGSFYTDTLGYLKNTGGYYLQAWPTDRQGNIILPSGNTGLTNQNIISGQFLETVNLNRVGGTADETTNISIGANLPANDLVGAGHDVDVQFFDTLGNTNAVAFKFSKTAANQWDLAVEPPKDTGAVTLYDAGDPSRVYKSVGQLEFATLPKDGDTIELAIPPGSAAPTIYEFDDPGGDDARSCRRQRRRDHHRRQSGANGRQLDRGHRHQSVVRQCRERHEYRRGEGRQHVHDSSRRRHRRRRCRLRHRRQRLFRDATEPAPEPLVHDQQAGRPDAAGYHLAAGDHLRRGWTSEGVRGRQDGGERLRQRRRIDGRDERIADHARLRLARRGGRHHAVERQFTPSFIEQNGARFRLLVLGGVTLALIGFFVWVIARASAPQQALLYSDLDIADAGRVASQLDASDIPYHLGNGGTSVYVAADQVARTRVALAERGLPAGGSVGYEIFDAAEPLGTTSFQQNLNLVRARRANSPARSARSIPSRPPACTWCCRAANCSAANSRKRALRCCCRCAVAYV